MKVSNRKCVRHLAWKSLLASRTRNLIAIVAIALTTMLFTSLFTIALSINDGFQQSNFRQVGGFSHGGFKYMTQAQFDELKDDPLIGQWGERRYLGMPREMLFAEENDQPLSAANDALAVLLQNYYGNENADYDVDYVEVRGRARKHAGRTKNDLGAYKKDYPKGTYYISFRQKIGGLPVYMEIGQKMLTTDKTHVTQETALKCSRVSWININGLEYMDGASFMLNATWMREEKRIQEDVPLATLDEVIQALEKKIEEGYIRDIYALRLGCVCYLDDTSPDTYTLYPTWVCDCIYANSPREQIEENDVADAFRENYRYEQIFVDAQTCDIQAGWIDRDEGLYHAEPMTWGKMQ